MAKLTPTILPLRYRICTPPSRNQPSCMYPLLKYIYIFLFGLTNTWVSNEPFKMRKILWWCVIKLTTKIITHCHPHDKKNISNTFCPYEIPTTAEKIIPALTRSPLDHNLIKLESKKIYMYTLWCSYFFFYPRG